MSKHVLPAKYYLYHFEEFLETIETQMAFLLEDSHRNFLANYHQLSEDARCLLIRMLNRKGAVFSLAALPYPEIGEINLRWEELSRHDFLRPLALEDLTLYLDGFTKPQLLELLPLLGLPPKRSTSRHQLREQLRVHEGALWPLLPGTDTVMVLQRRCDVDYLYFLYFGKLQEKLILPTLRDLGIRRSNKTANFVSKFQTIQEAKDHFFYCKLARDQKKDFTIVKLTEVEAWPPPQRFETRALRETLLLAQAQHHRFLGSLSESVKILDFCTTHPARERRARILFELGDRKACRRELQQILEDPNCDEELLFAEDFLERKFGHKRLSTLTEMLRGAERQGIDEAYFRHPELGVIAHFKAQGLDAYFSENELWAPLFRGLFEAELGASLHSEFDQAPVELVEKTFYQKHRQSIDQKLGTLTHEKLANLAGDNELLAAFAAVAPLAAVKSMLLYLAQDFFDRCQGFPDVLVIRNATPSFIEVKAPGDSLKASQLKQLRQLERSGFSVKLLQVEYNYSEQQEYVVVDLETTGSNSPWNRITEIGAVRVRGGEIIASFQTLVNPQRPIPRRIQDLTGITNEMVRNAPTFEALAPAFLEFSGAAIFVAHNVSFDYGFLQNEFARLDERFVRPYVCTKSSIKKHFPGLASYGLKALCQHFSIPLETHHRALNDARAAAELLLLVNRRRKEEQM